MKNFIILLILSMQVPLVEAQESKPLESYMAKKGVDFKEITVRMALGQIFEQMDNPHAIVLPANDPEIVKSFEKDKFSMRLNCPVLYEELIRQVMLCGGLRYKFDGGILRVLTETQDLKEQPEIWVKIFKPTKGEFEALGMLDDEGNIDWVALNKWLFAEAGESAGYSRTRKTFVIMAYRHKVESLTHLLSLHREGYKVPKLYSNK